MRILVTGAAGFIGSHTSERLSEMGHKVIGVDNFSDYYDVKLKELNAKALFKKGIPVHKTDLCVDDLASLFKDRFDYIFHFSAQPGIAVTSTFKDYLDNNFVATQRLMDAIEDLEHKPFFVNIATSSIYGLYATMTEDEAPKPASWYGVTKLAAEQLVLAYSRRGLLKSASLRLYSVYGPRERPDKLYTRLIDCGLNDKAFPLFKGSEKHLRSFTYVQDIVDGIVSVIGKEEVTNGEIFNLGTEQENSTATGITTVEDILQIKIKIEHKPARPGDQSRTKANIDKARKLLGYNPTTRLEEGLRAQVDWFKDNFC
ncbi:MAG: GDP-mannose 4,6-dehydratase [Bacteroidia bacterium]|nr:GDP-mannose 4,6-dehydratase [Bacteroidia bacterium]NNF30290.1 NAD-dependent epimerase/dehydratase family protein [Flavobacteriaceae bacterium]NNJ81205.1 NAD-dependent epimerase/dehydratase family protein [Flavobacteriaceae bacterium]NNK53565.1 NAD-dependent epimerase/dehydratase family protein [Flavobacteriaceae bacterium]